MIDDESFKDKPYEEKIKIMSGMTEKEISDGLEQIRLLWKVSKLSRYR